MPFLTKRDITIAIFKAAISQLPGVGPFVAEGVGAIDQRATFGTLEARIARLEALLLSGDVLTTDHIGGNALHSLHMTPDIQSFTQAYAAATRDPILLEQFLIKLNESPPTEYLYARHCVRIYLLYHILANQKPMVVTSNSISISPSIYPSSEGPMFTDKARDALISATVQELTKVSDDKDFFISYSVTSNGCKTEYAYEPIVWELLGIQLSDNGQHFEAIESFIRSVELGIENTDKVFVDIAVCFFNAGYRQYGLDRLRQMVNDHKYDLYRRYKLAETLNISENCQEAAIHFQAFIDEYEDRPKRFEGYTYGKSTKTQYEQAKFILKNLTQ